MLTTLRRWFWYMLAGLYFIIPIDVLPDLLPPITWGDDLGFLFYAIARSNGAPHALANFGSWFKGARA